MLGLEGADLEIKGNQRLEKAMVKEQVDEVFLAPEGEQPKRPIRSATEELPSIVRSVWGSG